MKPTFLSSLTVFVTAFGAITALALPYLYGMFPGGALADSAVGSVPLWAVFSALALLMLIVLVGHLRELTRSADQPSR